LTYISLRNPTGLRIILIGIYLIMQKYEYSKGSMKLLSRHEIFGWDILENQDKTFNSLIVVRFVALLYMFRSQAIIANKKSVFGEKPKSLRRAFPHETKLNYCHFWTSKSFPPPKISKSRLSSTGAGTPHAGDDN